MHNKYSSITLFCVKGPVEYTVNTVLVGVSSYCIYCIYVGSFYGKRLRKFYIGAPSVCVGLPIIAIRLPRKRSFSLLRGPVEFVEFVELRGLIQCEMRRPRICRV